MRVLASLLLLGGVFAGYFLWPLGHEDQVYEPYESHSPPEPTYDGYEGAPTTGTLDDTLGGAPLCEPSAARVIQMDGRPWVLIGDNEIDDQLFAIPINGDRLEPAERRDLPFPNGSELEDIEALTIRGNTLEIYGSHSRNKRCKQQPERRGIIKAKFAGGGLAEDRLGARGAIGCDLLPGATALCDVLARSENAATAVLELKRRERPDACDVDPAFNLEGALLMGADRWVGLRAPLLQNRAVLLKRDGGESLGAVASATLELGGRGVRELALHGAFVYGIAGPPADGEVPFQLFRFPSVALKPGAQIKAEFLQALPTSSEGLAIHEGWAYILIDGAEGSSRSGPCKREGRWTRVKL